MAKSDFIPVSPQELNSLRNSVQVLYELENPPQIPELPAGTNMNAQVDIKTTQLTVGFSGSIGVAGIANISTDTNYEYYAMDIMKAAVIPGDISGPVMSATYGIGCRILLKIKKIEAEVDIKLPQLAAQTELGMVDTSISLELRGFGAGALPNIPDGIFTFSEFDLDKYSKVNKMIDDIENFLTNPDNENTYDPVLVGIELKRLHTDDMEEVMVWGNYALWRIRQGDTLKQSFDQAEGKGIALDSTAKDIIRRTYALLMQRPPYSLVGSENQQIGNNEPNSMEETKAKQMLIKYRHINKKDV